MKKFFRIIKYDLPLHIVLIFTNWLPDNVIFIRLRGMLVSFFLKKSGKRLGIGRNVTIYNPSEIELGNDVYIAYGCHLSGKILIEDEVLFGPYCVIAPGNHTRGDNKSFRYGKSTESKIIVKYGAWIGAQSSIIGNNTVLGSGSVLAANSTLVKSADSDSIYGGIPAKKIKTSND